MVHNIENEFYEFRGNVEARLENIENILMKMDKAQENIKKSNLFYSGSGAGIGVAIFELIRAFKDAIGG